MIEIFGRMICIGKDVGTVTSAMMYDNGFLTVEGETKDGKKFSLNLTVREEEENA